MKKFLIVMTALALGGGIAQANLLVNGGFEDGTTSWTGPWGNGTVENWNTPPEGTEAFYLKGNWAGSGTNEGILQATGAGSITPGSSYTVSGSFYLDNGWTASAQGVKLEFFDSGNNLLGGFTNSLGDLTASQWNTRSLTATAPNNSSYAQVVFEVTGAGAGGVLGADNLGLSAQAVPEPTSAALFGLIGVGLVLFRRKKI